MALTRRSFAIFLQVLYCVNIQRGFSTKKAVSEFKQDFWFRWNFNNLLLFAKSRLHLQWSVLWEFYKTNNYSVLACWIWGVCKQFCATCAYFLVIHRLTSNKWEWNYCLILLVVEKLSRNHVRKEEKRHLSIIYTSYGLIQTPRTYYVN